MGAISGGGQGITPQQIEILLRLLGGGTGGAGKGANGEDLGQILKAMSVGAGQKYTEPFVSSFKRGLGG